MATRTALANPLRESQALEAYAQSNALIKEEAVKTKNLLKKMFEEMIRPGEKLAAIYTHQEEEVSHLKEKKQKKEVLREKEKISISTLVNDFKEDIELEIKQMEKASQLRFLSEKKKLDTLKDEVKDWNKRIDSQEIWIELQKARSEGTCPSDLLGQMNYLLHLLLDEARRDK